MKNVITRTLTGAAFILFILAGMFIHPLSNTFVFGVLTILGMAEFKHFLAHKDNKLAQRHLIEGISIYLLISLSIYHFIPEVLLWLIAIIILTEYVILLLQNKDKQMNNWSSLLLTLIYIVVPFSMIHLLSTVNPYSPLLGIGLFIIIWTNDTGAYCVGMTLGKHKLFPRVSPKKSWEGAIGGIFASVGVGAIFAHYTDLSLWFWLMFAFFISIASILGDLFESMLKRQLEIKDSGTILPGHGGILDRLDSALFAIPIGVVYINIFFYF